MSDTILEQTQAENVEMASDVPQAPAVEIKKTPKKHAWVPYLILAVLFISGFVVYLCLPGAPQDTLDPNQPWFSVQNGVLQYDSSLYTGPKELIVPSEIAGQTVTAIGGGCFAGDSYIITVTLPKTVESIGASAFADCTSLRGVFIPESVTKIGASAFSNCIALESVCVPHTVVTIGTDAFHNCPKLIHIFYTGSHESWASLYTERISAQTKVYAANGTVKQDDIVAAAESSDGFNP